MIQSNEYHVLVVDLETRKGTAEVGGWDALKRGEGGISALVVHDSETDSYQLYDDACLEQFALLAEQPEVVLVGYNSKEFDLPIIQTLLGRRLRVAYHIDIFDLIKDALNREGRTRERGWKLGDVGLRCMGISKSGEGAFAPDLAKAGRFAELFTYCRDDVDLTRQLLDYIRRHGGVLSHDGALLELDIPKWLRFSTAPLEA